MRKEYTTIQIDKELYREYSNYCKDSGKTVTGSIRNFIKKELGIHSTTPSKRSSVLRVKTSHENDHPPV